MKSLACTWSGSIRVPRHRLEQYKRHAQREGWRLSELARMLVSLGATIYFLRLRNPEAFEQFRLFATLNRAYGALDKAVRGQHGRRNEPKHLEQTALLPVHLPAGLYDIISVYSAATGTSRNALMNRYLEAGFILYLLGQNTLLKTIRSAQKDRAAS